MKMLKENFIMALRLAIKAQGDESVSSSSSTCETAFTQGLRDVLTAVENGEEIIISTKGEWRR